MFVLSVCHSILISAVSVQSVCVLLIMIASVSVLPLCHSFLMISTVSVQSVCPFDYDCFYVSPTSVDVCLVD